MYEGNYEALANAIIKQAVKDFLPETEEVSERWKSAGYCPGDHKVLLFTVLRSADESGWSCAAASDHEGNR